MGNDYKKALEILSDSPDAIKTLSSCITFLDGEISLPNVKMPTLGGEVFWTNLAEYNGWRLQQNDVFKNARILDPENMRVAWGTVNGMYKVLDRLVESMKESRYAPSSEQRGNAVNQLKNLKELLDIGAITESEYQEKKKKYMELL
jgi:hypothetical protein